MGDLPSAAAFIDGEFRAGGGAEHVHRDPAAGQELRSWRLCGPDDVDDAIASALRAQRVWQNLDSGRRRDALLSLATTVETHADTLAGLVSLEMGMPLRASKAGVHAAADWFRHFAGYADKIEGSVPSVGSPGRGLDYTRYAPHGVVAAIIPWNGPVIALALETPWCSSPPSSHRSPASTSRLWSSQPGCPRAWSTSSPGVRTSERDCALTRRSP
jgi:aldehyde dehydrogenase (NAD+)